MFIGNPVAFCTGIITGIEFRFWRYNFSLNSKRIFNSRGFITGGILRNDFNIIGTLKKFITKLIIPVPFESTSMLSYNLPSRINKMVDFGSAVPTKTGKSFPDKIIPFGKTTKSSKETVGGTGATVSIM